jgi:outer membrane protein assembly factor BamB
MDNLMRKIELGMLALVSVVSMANAAMIVDLHDGTAAGATTMFSYDNLGGASTFSGGVFDDSVTRIENTLTATPISGGVTATITMQDSGTPLTWGWIDPLAILTTGGNGGNWGPSGTGYLYADDAMLIDFNASGLNLDAGQSLVFSFKISNAAGSVNAYQRTGASSASLIETVSGGVNGGWSQEIEIPIADGYGTEVAMQLAGGWSGIVEMSIDIIGGTVDTNAPTPNPATWASPLTATSPFTITMTATIGSDESDVEYYFISDAGNPSGGTDSGWQSSPTYIDTGLDASTTYSYYVRMRDTVGNTGSWSSVASATTLLSPFPSDWPDLDKDGIPDLNDPDMDGDHMWDKWELDYFSSLSDTDGSNDSDDDGQSDYYEFLAGSNPDDPESVGERFGLTNAQTITSSNTVMLVWAAGEDNGLGTTYYINHSTNLTTWRTLSPNEYHIVSMENIGSGINRITLEINGMESAHGFFSISRYSVEEPGFLSSGISDIDQIRQEVESTPIITTEEEFLSRRAALARWFRLLWHQGFDMSSFTDVSMPIVGSDASDPNDWDTLAVGFAALEAIHASPVMISEIVGIPETVNTNKTDWPMYMSTDGSNTGFSPDQGPSTGRIAWRFPKQRSWDARPIIEDGRIYLTSPGVDVFCYCLDEASGTVLWQARQYGFDLYHGNKASMDPVLSPDRVLIRFGNNSNNISIQDKQTGETIDNPTSSGTNYWVFSRANTWIRAADADSGEYITQFNMDSNAANEPVFVDGKVYAASVDGKIHCRRLVNSSFSTEWTGTLPAEPSGGFSAENGRVCIGTTDHRIFALNELNGSVLWSWQCPDPDTGRARQFLSTPRDSGGRVYVGAANGKLYCLNAASGGLLWEFDTGSWIRSRPLVVGSTVYVSDIDGVLYAIEDMESWAELSWSSKLNAHGFTADLVGNENRILASGRDLILYSVSPDTGKVQWQHGIKNGSWIEGEFFGSGGAPGFMTTPTVVDNVMYIGGPDGFVNAVDVDTGEEIWRTELGGTLSAAPVVAEGKVFIGQISNKKEFFALNQTNGLPVWINSGYGGTWVSSAYNDGRLFVGNIAGEMYGIDASDGTMLWSYDTDLDKDPGDTKTIGIYSVPCIDSTNVYVGSWSGYYYSFNQITGALNWKTKTKGSGDGGRPDSAAVMIHKDHVYVQKGGHHIDALDKTMGAANSTWTAPGGYLQNGTVAAYGDMVFGSAVQGVTLLPRNATIYAFDDVENGGLGSPQWSYVGGGGLTAPVTTTNKVIFGSSADVFVTCVDLDTGDVKWRTYTGGRMMENVPAIYGNKVFVQSENGWVFAIE